MPSGPKFGQLTATQPLPCSRTPKAVVCRVGPKIVPLESKPRKPGGYLALLVEKKALLLFDSGAGDADEGGIKAPPAARRRRLNRVQALREVQ